MAIQVFAITFTTVKQDFFPNFSGLFSDTSTPTSTRVTQFIKEEAADLAGHLRLKALTAAGIAADTTSEAYAWCQKTLGIGVAARVARVLTGANPEYAKELATELAHRYALLDTHGAEALGLGATVADSTDEPEGPTSHIDELDLDTGEDDDLNSDVAPVIRRADVL